MISKFLQMVGLKSRPNLVEEPASAPTGPGETIAQITVFIMSEGTAQGEARPFRVCKETVWRKDRSVSSLNECVRHRVREILKYGYGTTQADGVNVTFAPNTIYKVTWKRMDDDDKTG